MKTTTDKPMKLLMQSDEAKKLLSALRVEEKPWQDANDIRKAVSEYGMAMYVEGGSATAKVATRVLNKMAGVILVLLVLLTTSAFLLYL